MRVNHVSQVGRLEGGALLAGPLEREFSGIEALEVWTHYKKPVLGDGPSVADTTQVLLSVT
jgi:hypothetical protein